MDKPWGFPVRPLPQGIRKRVRVGRRFLWGGEELPAYGVMFLRSGKGREMRRYPERRGVSRFERQQVRRFRRPHTGANMRRQFLNAGYEAHRA